ncbi:MAG: ABC transporter permease [Marinifilaceae bacterium]
MNIQNIKIAFKNLQKNRLVTGLNIFGLALGITISLLIFSYVRKEQNMDHSLPDLENIYVLTNGEGTSTSSRMADLVRKHVPEIGDITYAQYEWSRQIFLGNENNKFKIKKLLVADSAFFRVFQFDAVYGNPATSFNKTNTVVLTESLARKIFGNENPVGRELEYNSTNLQNELLQVGAVIKDLPSTSSWNFEAVLSVQTNCKIGWYARLMTWWGTQNYTSFFRLPKQVTTAQIQEKLAGIPTTTIPEKYKQETRFGMFPFRKSYFDLPEAEILKHGNRLTLIIIQVIGVLILLLACINYINLVTAQRLKRLKNIGILKAIGSKKGKIVTLITTESALVLCITLFLVILLSNYLLSGLNHLTQSQFTLVSLLSGWNLVIFLSILMFTLLVTGIIPGYLFSKHETTLLLKNSVQTNKKNHLRNGLLVFQFTISIVLLVSILFINRQNNFLQQANPGFKKENIVYTPTNAQIKKNIQVFRNEVAQIPGVIDITFSSALLGYNQGNWGTTLVNKGENQEIRFANFYVSPNFFDFFGIKLLRGKTFDEYSSGKKDLIFNEFAVEKFKIDQLEDAYAGIGKKGEGAIIGEVENFHFESMHVPIRSVAFLCAGDVDQVAYLKVNTIDENAFDQSMKALKKVWNRLSPDFPLEIQFLDTKWEALYLKDRQFQRILHYATLISLLLSCLGLISLTFFVVETYTKEIGVRKINGAKTHDIILMLNKDLIKWVCFAFMLACPIAWFALNKWLEGFAYRAELSWWIFALAGLIALGIALLTVSFQSYRAATRNPVESLRYE